jgi:hypothetical protein
MAIERIGLMMTDLRVTIVRYMFEHHLSCYFEKLFILRRYSISICSPIALQAFGTWPLMV